MTNRNVLYQIYNADGELLYVGATTNPGSRLYQHARTQPWWDEADTIKLERFDTREELLSAEDAAIQINGPKYNLLPGLDLPWMTKPRRPRGEGSFYKRPDGYWVGQVEIPAPRGVYKRVRKRVMSRDRETALRKFEALKQELR